ncbi:hypothetical protein EX30DRAFT_341175 [Ascodesmis nigricans]|uniref:Uncharacterized protein n=1 Tax=Ascodesmis nigricans TaxID=341454 RepID=A0A4V3SIN9_9PEZI|nr:hypothetical protein EX30DRAFT_341175 [Ascodesmis nigricans]
MNEAAPLDPTASPFVPGPSNPASDPQKRPHPPSSPEHSPHQHQYQYRGMKYPWYKWTFASNPWEKLEREMGITGEHELKNDKEGEKA